MGEGAGGHQRGHRHTIRCRCVNILIQLQNLDFVQNLNVWGQNLDVSQIEN